MSINPAEQQPISLAVVTARDPYVRAGISLIALTLLGDPHPTELRAAARALVVSAENTACGRDGYVERGALEAALRYLVTATSLARVRLAADPDDRHLVDALNRLAAIRSGRPLPAEPAGLRADERDAVALCQADALYRAIPHLVVGRLVAPWLTAAEDWYRQHNRWVMDRFPAGDWETFEEEWEEWEIYSLDHVLEEDYSYLDDDDEL